MRIGITAVAVALGVALAGSGLASGSAPGAGSVAGKVTFGGAVKPMAVKVDKDQAVCGKSPIPYEDVIVGSGKGLKNAVVSLDKVAGGKPAAPTSVQLGQKGCVYVPHVAAATVGSQIVMASQDPVLHNVHAYGGGGSTLFNVAIPIPGMNITKKLDKPGVVTVKCDAGHTWMKAFVHVFDHAYFAVTAADGSFSLADVPAGTYKLKVWHETLGEKSADVTVAAGGAANTTVAY